MTKKLIKKNPKKGAKASTSIIEIIQEMVAKGEPEAKIIRTLQDLGVEPEKAKRLLLLGQADTFALIRGEIGKIVEVDVEAAKTDLQNFIAKESERQTKGLATRIEKQIRTDLETYERSLTGQSEKFRKQINETVSKVASLSNRVRSQLNNLGQQVKTVRMDMDEMKISGVSSRNRLVSIVLLLFGIAFIALDLWKFISEFQAVVSIDSVILTVIYAFVGMGLLFLASQI
jgi:hypothetical protein